MHTLRLFLGLIRFSHTIFALPFALSAAVLAWQVVPFHWQHLLGIMLCMVCARSAAMAFNRIVDRRLDAKNPRTAGRHLPAGLLNLPAVVAFFVFSAAGFVVSTMLFWPNRWPLLLALPVLVFICGYSFAKRFTALAHVWLGASLMLAPLAAWIALRGMESLLTPVILGLIVLFWVAGFDILYACQDVEFDRQAKLHSVPATVGVPRALNIAAGSHAVMALLLIVLWLVAQPALGWIYLIGICIVIALLIYEHRLVRPDDLNRVNAAFFQVNAVISLGLFALIVIDQCFGLKAPIEH
jgi:4-hydroxybenzoate polyprenyltransferase